MNASRSVPPDPRPQLVGREREQAVLAERLAAALAGRGGLVLVGGEAGIGKTTLVNWLTAEAARQGALVLSGGCYDLTTTPPYGPWIELVSQDAADPQRLQVPAILHHGDAGTMATHQQALFEEVCAFLAALAAIRPVLLILEDLHWADAASLDLLRFVARHVRRWPLLLLCTYRVDALTHDHALVQLLPSLVRESQAARIDLRRLDPEAIDYLLRERYGMAGRDQQRLADYLQQLGDGNPLYTVELLRTLEGERLLRPTTDGWVLADLGAVHLPPLLRQLIDRRVSHLATTTRHTLAIAAVIGQEIPVDLWRTLSGLTHDALADIVEEAQTAHVLEELPDRTGLRFTHALIREAVYDGISLPRRRLLHQQTAEALAAVSTTPPASVASHFQQAGDPRAIEWHVRAGLRARQSTWISAAGDFEAAAMLLDGDAARVRERGWLRIEAGYLLRFAGVARSIALLEMAEQLAAVVDDPVLAAYARLNGGRQRCTHGDIHRGIMDLRHAVAAIDAMLETHDVPSTEDQALSVIRQLLPDTESGRGQTDAARLPGAPRVNQQRGILVNWLAHSGHYREAIATGAAYIDEMMTAFGDGHLQRLQRVVGQLGMGHASAALGRPADARREYQLVRESFRSRADYAMAEHEAWFDLLLVHIPYYTDQLAERAQLLTEAKDAWERCYGLTVSMGQHAPSTLLIDHLEGRWGNARQLALEQRTAPLVAHVHQAILALGIQDRHRGAPERAWECVAQLLPHGPATQLGNGSFAIDIDAVALAAELALDAGDVETARRWIEAHDRWLDWSGARLWQADNRLLWARLSQVSGDLDHAREAAGSALAYASDPRQPLRLIAIHRLLGQLALLDRRNELAQVHLSESLVLAERCAVSFERGMTLLTLAQLQLASGKGEDTQTSLEQVREIGTVLGARPMLQEVEELERVPGVARTSPTAAAGLSPRELDVVRLLVEGKSNQEIAAALFISPNTVGNHVASIMNKLGLDSRTAVAAWAVRHGVG